MESTTQAARPRLGRRPALTGVRGLAIVMVLVQHIHLGPIHDARGVDVFFVLSGFLITVLLLEEVATHRRIDYKRFYLRRLLRLYPAMLAMVAVVTVVFVVWAPPEWRSHTEYGAVLAVTYLTNLARGLWRSPVEPFEHTWSLALEEQFYIVWPITLRGLMHLARDRARVLVMLVAGLIVLDMVYATWFFQRTADFPHLYVGFEGRGVQLLMGCLLGILFHYGMLDAIAERVGGRWLAAGGWLAVGGLLLVMPLEPFGSSPDARSSVGMLDMPVCGLAAAVLILAVIVVPDSRLARFLSTRVLVGLGLISYSLYLWHMPVIWFVDLSPHGTVPRIVLILAASFALALASWFLIERPVGRWRDRRANLSPSRVSIDARSIRT